MWVDFHLRDSSCPFVIKATFPIPAFWKSLIPRFLCVAKLFTRASVFQSCHGDAFTHSHVSSNGLCRTDSTKILSRIDSLDEYGNRATALR